MNGIKKGVAWLSGLAMVLGLFTLVPLSADALAPTWDVSGDYTWVVLGTYSHDITLAQNPDGTFTGTGGYPSGASPYTGPGQTTETITGEVVGNTITFTTEYDGPYNPDYSVTVSGTIAPDGTISGTSPWAWEFTTGSATEVTTNTTVVVSGNTSLGENQPGWLFNRDTDTDTPYEFNDDEMNIGNGSLYVLPIGPNASDKFIAENFINTPVADVDYVTYDFLMGDGNDGMEEHFYMNVYANFGVSDELKFYDCRYNIVPTAGSTSDWTTVTFDPTLSYPVTTRTGDSQSPHTCPAVPADMDILSPGSNIRMFALNVGDTSSNDEELDGYLDNVVVKINSVITTYDFDPFVRTAEITAPDENEQVVQGLVDFTAFLSDDDADAIQWAVRKGTCAAGTNTVFGNVDGHTDSADINQGDLANQTFSFTGNMSAETPGMYCFIYNPVEDSGEDNIRLTRNFELVEAPNTPLEKDDCKKGGWSTLVDNEGNSFKNQGDCVSFVATGGANPGSGE